MPNMSEWFSAAACPQCIGNPRAEHAQEFAAHPYCGTPSRAVDMQRCFRTGHDLETLVQNAEMYIKLGNYDAATEIFAAVSKEYPGDYRGWWGLVRSETRGFTSMSTSPNEIEMHASHAEAVAPPEARVEIDRIRGDFLEFMETQKAKCECVHLLDEIKKHAHTICFQGKTRRREIAYVAVWGALGFVFLVIRFASGKWGWTIAVLLSLLAAFIMAVEHSYNIAQASECISHALEETAQCKAELERIYLKYPELRK